MDLETLWRIIDEGSTPAIALIAYLIWKLERSLNEFIVEVRAKQEQRETKIEEMHNDIKAVIRRLMGAE